MQNPVDSRLRGNDAFQSAAKAALGRLVLARWLALLARTAPVLFLAAAGLLLALGIYGNFWIGPAAGVALVAVWLAAASIWTWRGRPTSFAALAAWDERTGRNEMFASALCFERQSPRSAGQELHLATALQRLQQDQPRLTQQIPAPLEHRVWFFPLSFLALAVAATFFTAAPVDSSVDDAARAKAREVGDALAAKTKVLDPLAGLSEIERKQVEALKEALNDTADKLRQLEKETPRQTLGELEARAREAEKLAEALGKSDAEKVSSEMIAELERHADTADLAAALRAEDAGKIAGEAEKLGQRLDRDDLSLEERKRIEEALDKSMRAASDRDKQGLIGKHLNEADQHLKQKERGLARKKLEDLAQTLNRVAQRKQSGRQLQQLARNLRSSGQQIFGRNTSGIQRLAQNQQQSLQGLQRLSSQAARPIALLPGGQRQAGQQGRLSQGQPGQAQSGQAGQPTTGNPSAGVPGSAPIPGSGATQAPVPGGSGQAPIPGTGSTPGQSGAGQSGAGQSGAGSAPVPGSGAGQAAAGAGQAGSGSGTGGHQAGSGTAPYGNTATKALAATKTGTVNAQASGNGPSQVRQIDPQQHQEQSQRGPREIAIDFIKVEEEALAEEPLPLARREQVLRYFTSLRRQLVESDTSAPSGDKPK